MAIDQADFAAIDAVTWEMLQIDDLETVQQLRVIAKTAPPPALPFITSLRQDSDAIATAVEHAIAALPAVTRDALLLNGLAQLPSSAYLEIPFPLLP